MTIFFRVDGNSQIGYGHLSRCISLAEIVNTNFECCFLIREDSYEKSSEIITDSYKIFKIPASTDSSFEAKYIASNFLTQRCIVVLDGYAFNSGYQRILKEYDIILVSIDDNHEFHFYSDYIINQAMGIDESIYSMEKYTKILSGANWLLLRLPFYKLSKQNRKIIKLDKAFLTLGGTYIPKIGTTILEAIEGINEIQEIELVSNESIQFNNEIELFLKETTKKITIHKNLNANQMANVIKDCNMAICPSSIISLEACCVGIGLFSGYTTENQIDTYNGLVNSRLIYGFDNLRLQSVKTIRDTITSNLSLDAINKQVGNQKQIFNGESQNNLLELFNSIKNADNN